MGGVLEVGGLQEKNWTLISTDGFDHMEICIKRLWRRRKYLQETYWIKDCYPKYTENS